MRIRLSGVAKQTSKKIATLAAAGVMAFSGLALAAPMFFAGVAHAAAGNDLYVNAATGDDRHTCLDSTNPCRTLNKAVQNSSDGDTIHVAAGDYTSEDTITLSKELILEGAESGVAAANDLTGTPRSGDESVVASFDVTTSNVIIDGFSVTDMRVDGPSTGVLSGLDIENNIFSGYSDVALPTYDAGGVAIQNNYFTAPVGSAEAMQIKSSTTVAGCSNTQVLDNVFDGATNNGASDINFSCTDSHSTGVSIIGNYSTGNSGGSSLTAFSGVDSDITITSNTATTTGSSVFFAGNVSGTVEMDKNHFTNGAGYAVSIHGGDGVLGTDDSANSGTFTIVNNDLSGNVAAINIAAGSLVGAGTVVANNNDMSGNTGLSAFNNASGVSVNATHNYWGASPDFSTLISGSDVSYSPYYINSSRTHLNTDVPSHVYVDDNYSSTGTNDGHEYGWDAFSTIQEGVNAVDTSGTVTVAAGTYNEDLSVSKSLTLLGAQAGNDARARAGSESVITGQITISASDVTVDGFTLTNPSGDYGVVIPHVSGVTISDNIISDVGTSVTSTNVYGIWYQSSTAAGTASDITISDNQFSNIGSASNAHSNGAILIGDSASHQNITSGLVISDNTVSSVSSSTKGAYGIEINLGSAADTASVSGASITGNDISGLSGGWKTAIGLEADTPNAALTDNTIQGSVTAVNFEVNPNASTVSMSGNTLNSKTITNSADTVTVNPAVSLSTEANTYPEVLNGDTYNYIGLNVFPTIQGAVNAVSDGGAVKIGGDITTSSAVVIDKSLTIDGQGHNLNATFAKTDSSNNAAIEILHSDVTVQNLIEDGTGSTGLHGINIYASTGVTLDTVTVSNNAHDGIVVNGSSVTVNDVTTSGNGWGGIDVDQGSGVTSAAILTVNGTSMHDELIPIQIDDVTKDVSVIDTNHQYSFLNSGNLRIYTLLQSDQTAPDNSGNATADSSTPQVVVSSSTQPLTVTVTSGTDASLDFSALVTNGVSTSSATLPQTTIQTTNSQVSIPASTTVTANDPAWDGVINAPQVLTSTSVPVTTPGGYSTTLGTVIQVGSDTADLSFDSPVEIVISGQAGQLVGFVRDSSFTQITERCTSSTPAIGELTGNASGACYISDDGSGNLIVWTSHFTEFVTYSQTKNKSKGTSGNPGSNTSGSSSSTPATVVTSSSAPGTSSVKGQSTKAASGQTSSASVETPTASLTQPKVAAKEAGALGLRWYWIVLFAVIALALAATIAYRYAEGTDRAS